MTKKTVLMMKIRHDLPYPLYPPWDSEARGPTKAPLVIAVKRVASRLRPDLFPWRKFDEHYSRPVADVIKRIQRQAGITPTGSYGKETHAFLLKARIPKGKPHYGELAYDSVALAILEQEWQRMHPVKDALTRVRDEITKLGYMLIERRAYISYSQTRPMEFLYVNPFKERFRADCSGIVTGLCKWARTSTGIAIPDPNGRGYDGFGWTGTLINNSTSLGRYLEHVEVGDLAFYGRHTGLTAHVIMCVKRGTPNGTAEYISHGRQIAPELRGRATYRKDFLGIWRLRLVP